MDNAANEMLVKVLAGTFGVPANAITILSGATSRTKGRAADWRRRVGRDANRGVVILSEAKDLALSNGVNR